MNIACDIRVFLAAETGVGTYFKNLLSHMALIDDQNRYLLFSSSWKMPFPTAKIPAFTDQRLVDARIPVKALNWLWHHWQRPRLEFFFKEAITVSHSPTPMPLPCRGKRIITIHDLFFVTHRELVQSESRRHFRRRLGQSVGRADGIICVSQTTRSRLLEMFPTLSAKIRVIPHGVASPFFSAPGIHSELRQKFNLPEKYILFTGTIEPRKDLPTLLRALLKLKGTGIVIPLVIAGQRGWGAAEFIALRKELGGQVHELGYVDTGELPGLYRSAQLFVFPSRDEGFGLPLLESLAAGTPVLCSDIPVFHEIGRELPTYFQSGNAADLAEKLAVLWKRDKETEREKGIVHARNFTWGDCRRQDTGFLPGLRSGALMKIAIDGYDLLRRSTGVGRYLRNLLPEILKTDPQNEYHLFLREDNSLFAGFSNLNKMVIPDSGGYFSWQNGPLRKKLGSGDYGFLFAASNQLPLFYNGKSVLTVHDVAWRAMPGNFSFKERYGKDWKCRWSMKKAERIYTDAEFTKGELIRFYRVAADKIHAIPLAIEPSFRRETQSAIDAFKQQHRLQGKKVIGFLGSIFTRRHVRELIQAFAQLRKKYDLALIIVGRNYAGNEMNEWLRREGIVWLEWLPEEQLNSFYSALDMFIYISAYEGFGFPPLEALACGTVPLLMPTSSLREMYHDLARFVAGPEPDQVAQAIGSFLDDQGSGTRRIMEVWLKRKDFFTWPRVAADYLQTLFK